MPAGFHEVQFPTDISHGSIGGPEFSTEVVMLNSGYEQRNQNWTYPRERWQVAYGVRTKSQLDALREFFYARRGMAYGFRFKSHDDYEASDVEIGTGDGTTSEFQLIKTYTSGNYTMDRKITKPVSGTVSIYIDSALQSSPGDYTIDLTTGIVDFLVAPGSGEVVMATFEFDIPMRFDTDHLAVNLQSYLARAADVPIVEIRL
jgi:uncharacterized protein (TIGR02217 family)